MQAVRAGAEPDAPPTAGRVVLKDPTIIQKQVAAPLGKFKSITAYFSLKRQAPSRVSDSHPAGAVASAASLQLLSNAGLVFMDRSYDPVCRI